jgi:hypothetical protein
MVPTAVGTVLSVTKVGDRVPQLGWPFSLLFLGTLHIKEPLVVTKYGTLQGKQLHVGKTPIHVFLGVPFSRPPVGARRFAPPEPLQPWTGIRDATTYPPA